MVRTSSLPAVVDFLDIFLVTITEFSDSLWDRCQSSIVGDSIAVHMSPLNWVDDRSPLSAPSGREVSSRLAGPGL